MRYILYVLLGIGLIIPNVASSRPVSYPGGVTVMLKNDGDKNTAHVHYSPTAKISVGYRFEYWREKEWTLNAIQMNNLLKRWNKKDSQANIYLKSGLGVAQRDQFGFESNTQVAGFTGVATDWENRRFFASYENRYTEAGDIDNFYQHTARVGWAPYVGDYGDLHTWFMLQVEHMPEANNKITVTPLVRFLKNVHLFEAGMNNRGEVLFNYVLRY